MGLPALLADYWFLAPLLKARLEDQVSDAPVDVCETVEQIYAADRREAVLLVMYAGDAILNAAAGGKSVRLRQRWMVLLALNNVARPMDARLVKGGPVLSRVHTALAGWTPAGCAHPFMRANAPLRPDHTQNKALYPLGFEIELAI